MEVSGWVNLLPGRVKLYSEASILLLFGKNIYQKFEILRKKPSNLDSTIDIFYKKALNLYLKCTILCKKQNILLPDSDILATKG